MRRILFVPATRVNPQRGLLGELRGERTAQSRNSVAPKGRSCGTGPRPGARPGALPRSAAPERTNGTVAQLSCATVPFVQTLGTGLRQQADQAPSTGSSTPLT
ncbi:hypothetical protein ACFPM0_33195 [Pseudonocardia sulfidoxydans]|uniref:hypothetical protein n=1 Tax=Pseudonocardia sulfidoxydans TaxID=54011 RepID=UPI003609619C